MERIITLIFILFSIGSKSQVCDPNGNVFLFTSFEGDIAVINVDQNIPDLRIGIFTSKALKIVITGPFTDQISEIVYAGYGTPNGGACGISVDSVEIIGFPEEAIKLYDLSRGRIGFTRTLGEDADFLPFPTFNCMYAPKSACNATGEELNNGAGQIVQFFLDEFGDESSLYAHYYEESCLSGSYFLSQGGNCCITETNNAPNPIYETNHSYNFFENDTLELCDNSLTLDIGFYPFLIQPPDFLGVVWNTGTTGPQLEINQPGEYSFTAVDVCSFLAGTFLSDTIRIVECCSLFEDLVIASDIGDTVCIGEEVILSTNYDNVQWSNGAVGNVVIVENTQSIIATTQVNGCSKSDAITINFIEPPILSISIDSPICPNTNVFVRAAGANNYVWNNTITEDSIVVRNNSDFEISLEGNIGGCSSDSTFQIEVFPSSEFSLGEDIFLDFPDFVEITPNQPINQIELISDFPFECNNCESIVINVQNSGIIVGKFIDEFGCPYHDNLRIDLNFECDQIYIPNAFSPDDDVYNETFCIYSECITNIDFKIYNRLGTLIYQSKDPENCWDGTFKSELLGPDYYLYQLNVSFNDGSNKIYNGHISLLR